MLIDLHSFILLHCAITLYCIDLFVELHCIMVVVWIGNCCICIFNITHQRCHIPVGLLALLAKFTYCILKHIVTALFAFCSITLRLFTSPTQLYIVQNWWSHLDENWAHLRKLTMTWIMRNLYRYNCIYLIRNSDLNRRSQVLQQTLYLGTVTASIKMHWKFM